MKIVYAMCSPRQLDFYLTDRREAVPSGATVFAICTGDRTIENQDEDLFAAISDEEYFTLRSMVKEAEQQEVNRQVSSAPRVGPSLRQFFRRLRALISGHSAQPGSRSRKFPNCNAGTVAPVRL
ncbi:MAG TPA: hypothetical protein VGC89_09210 [Pyrinomonadaceae bacterium]